MVAWDTIFLVVGILALVDSMIVFSFPNWSFKFVKKFVKNKKNLKKIAWTELILAIILIILGINI